MEKKSPQHALFLITLALMSMAGLVGTDVYLPALPEIGQYLQQNSASMQFTLGIYLCGLAFGQLVLGPLSDRWGRKKLLLWSMAVFFLASIGCASSHAFSHLIVYRALQALGACGGLVIGRAIVADLFKPEEAGRVFASIFPFVGMSPAISPAIGGFLAYYLGWRADFIFVALFALAVFLLSLKYIPESLPLKERRTMRFSSMFSTYSEMLLNRRFFYYAIAPCAAYIAFFAYIAQSPFIFHEQGFGERAIGLFYITLSLSYVAGSFTGRHLIKQSSLDDVLDMGFKCFVFGGIVFLLVGLMHLHLVFMVLAISVITFANGFLIPMGMAGVVGSFQGRVGYASGLLGFCQLGAAGLTSFYIGHISLNQVNRLAEFICFAIVVSAMIRWVLVPVRELNRGS